MTAKEIRRTFLEFFQSKNHDIVASASLVVKDDPTLMFTNAGMNQFKDYFLGHKTPEMKRIADTQKCLRVSGKHNDLEEVGLDTYHHTMFEMLGNWSFGDYFKKEAIAWAWELLTEKYNLDKNRLYASVFGGDEADNLQKDEEAYEYWKNYLPENRILFGSKKDNFWEMGDTGPCGPCSELHIDLRSEEERKKIPGEELVNNDHPLVVEIWNLVFMEFNRMASGELVPLPDKHIDTGMGFERLCMAVQGKESNYDTDVFTPLINLIGSFSGTSYGDNPEKDIAMRVISDHIRAVSFAISDGQLPSNTGAGYVIRRILRRAVRYGFTFLNLNEPFLHSMVHLLSEEFAEVFPELKKQKDFVSKVIREEEVAFLRTLENGLKRLDVLFSENKRKSVASIDGKTAFELYDTFGFPYDLTELIARENNFTVDKKGFDSEMKVQKERSRADAEKVSGDWITVHEGNKTIFTGYDNLVDEALILKYRKQTEKNKEIFQVVLDKTPFYAESGGQVGDTGYLEVNGQKYSVIDTQKENDLIIMVMNKLPEDLKAKAKCVVNKSKRILTMNNHSATHLLHAALRQVLGNHVEQRGSLVNEHLLRFDFSHFSKVSNEEIRQVEAIVNKKIRENIALTEMRDMPIAEATQLGAMALFGEKYGEKVRVIIFDKEYSVELCGGTHVESTGSIGFFKIISEGSVAAGVRRIEAITADAAENFIFEQEDLLESVKELLKKPTDVLKTINTMIEEKSALEKRLEQLQIVQINAIKESLVAGMTQMGEKNVIISEVELPSADALKKLSFDLKNKVKNLFMILAANIEGKPQIAVMLDDSLVKEGYNANVLIKELAKEINGGGGGQPFFAVAGGKEIKGLPEVVKKAKEIVSEK